MSFTLLYSNECKFAGCNLNFSTIYDLIAHIEIDHIPVVEAEELRRKEEDGSGRSPANSNLPLSYYYRLYPQPYRPTPCAPETVKVSFSHYKKRPAPGSTTTAVNIDPISPYPPNQNSPLAFQPKRRDTGETHSARSEPVEDEHTVPPEDLEEADPNDPEASERYRCQIKSCGKLYKNVHGVRNHMAVAHSAPTPATANDLEGTVVTAEGIAGQQSPSKTRQYKCTHCVKKYKSQNGLQAHMNKEHSGVPRADSPASAPMSPAAHMTEQKPQIAAVGSMRAIASQPHLSSMQQQHPYQQSPLAAQQLNPQSGITTHHPAPNVQVRQLPPPPNHQSGRSPAFQHQGGFFQLSDAYQQQSTGSVLQAQFQQQRRTQQLNVPSSHGSARSPAYVGSGGEYRPSASPQYNSDNFPQRPMVPANAANN